MTAAILTCECGEPLVGRQTVRCTRCTIKADPGSSQCPFCLEWYYTHSGRKGTGEIMDFHNKRKCKRG